MARGRAAGKGRALAEGMPTCLSSWPRGDGEPHNEMITFTSVDNARLELFPLKFTEPSDDVGSNHGFTLFQVNLPNYMQCAFNIVLLSYLAPLFPWHIFCLTYTPTILRKEQLCFMNLCMSLIWLFHLSTTRWIRKQKLTFLFLPQYPPQSSFPHSTHMHTHIHTHTNTHAHLHTQCRCTHMHTHTYMHVYIHGSFPVP